MAVKPIALGTATKGLINGTRGLGNKRTSRACSNESIIKIGQNTEKSPGDMRRLTFTQTSVED